MKGVIALGVVLMLVGGGLMLKGSYKTRERHEANVLGMKLGATVEERKPIPLALSGTLLGVGALLTVIGALKSRPR